MNGGREKQRVDISKEMWVVKTQVKYIGKAFKKDFQPVSHQASTDSKAGS